MTRLRHLLPLRVESTVVRCLRDGDVPAFHAYRSDPELARFQSWSPLPLAAARAFVAEMARVEALAPDDWVQLAIADAATDELLGDLGLRFDPARIEAEVGFTLCRAAQGAGHATRAVRAAVALVAQAADVTTVRATTDVRNAASIAVLERAGFRGVAERTAHFKGEPCVEIDFIRMGPPALPGPQQRPRSGDPSP